jgi:tRNA nucleotidyltransferase (CCA-adding enzyme)
MSLSQSAKINAVPTTRERILAHVRQMGLPSAYEVGGAVRDGLLAEWHGQPFDPKDVDIAVVGTTFGELLQRCRAEGTASELVVARQPIGVRLTAKWTPREGVEFALARTEVSTGASRHQFAIRAHPDVTIEQDLARRDFTVNAMARDVHTGALVDPFGGEADLRAGVLRTVSERSFPEDPLRILRGLARCARDGLVPEPGTREQMRAWGRDPRRYLGEEIDEATIGYRWYGDVPLSPERVWQELRKLLAGRHAAHALRIARETEVLGVLLPELRESIGFDQRSRHHDLTVDEHTLHVVEHACALDAPESVRLAALLHDCGKPATAWGWVRDGRGGHRSADAAEFEAAPRSERKPGDDHLHFYARPPVEDADGTVLVEAGISHEEEGARRARTALTRLAAPTDVREKVERLVREHMYGDDDAFATLAPAQRDRRARRFLQRIGPDNVEELMLLRRCDRAGKRDTPPPEGWDDDLKHFEATVREQLQRGAAVGVNDLAIDGRELIALGYSGVAIGEAKRHLLERVVDDPSLNTNERLLELAAQARDRNENAPHLS